MKKILLTLLICMTIFPAVSGETPELESRGRTAVEAAYIARIPGEGMPLQQIGYGLLDSWVPTVSRKVDEAYVIGPGDSLRLYLWGDPVDYGAVLSTYDMDVDSDGSIFIAPIGRVSVYGKTIPQALGILEVKFSIKYKNLNLELTPISLRSYTVYVSGFAARPGAVTVSSLWSAADVLGAAGGILPEGSLRDITIVRSGETRSLDLYELLLGGRRGPVEMQVSEGDILYIPPIGKTAAVIGDVRRPGIYELKESETVADLFAYAGGAGLAGSKPDIKLLRREGTGSTLIEGTTADAGFIGGKVSDGDIYLLQSGSAPLDNLVQVSGTVANPGLYTDSSVTSVRELVIKAGLLPETDGATAILTRKEKGKEEQKIIFSPARALSGEIDIPLRANDRIEFFTDSGKFALSPILVSAILPGFQSRHVPYVSDMTLLDTLKAVAGIDNPSSLEARIYREGKIAGQVVLRDLLVRGNSRLNLVLSPGDTVMLVPLDAGSATRGVQVLGQVARPGIYTLTDGMRLADGITAAGGYTARAFPEGMILNRISVQQRQLEQYRITLMKTREDLAGVEAAVAAQTMSAEARSMLTSQIETQRELITAAEERLGNALGRIILTIPPKLVDLNTSRYNIELQEGDVIYIPEKPQTISVFGDIGTAAALPWVQGKTVRDYLFELGGLRPRDYSISIVKHNGHIFTENNLFFGWSSIENQQLDQGDAVIAVKRITLPAASAFAENLITISDVVFKIVYSLDAAGII